MKEQWFLINNKDEKSNIDRLIKELNIDYFTAKLLVNRNIIDCEEAREFLEPDYNCFNDGFLMKDMDKGVSIIKDAIINKKKIVIYGDYDCDGVMSTVILYKAFSRLNADFKYHIPDRESEGYGMNSSRVKILKDEGVDVIITCDNGIAAFEEISLAKSLGMTVVITDHHDIPMNIVDGVAKRMIPDADAIIDIKQEDCMYPFKHLCGAGTALKFVRCLFKEMGLDNDEWKKYIEYAAIATVCDVVDLKGENRFIVKQGLKDIMNEDNYGLKCLIEEAGLKDKQITATHCGFVLGPCINATGRLESAGISVELLVTDDKEKAVLLAKKLVDLNKERQDMTMESIENVCDIIERNNMQDDNVLVVYSPLIHESIAGIVAGKVKEKYYRPSIVMTDGRESLKGSARSIDEYNIFEELSKCKDLLEKFGGHPMAAGLSVKKENLPILRQRLIDNCELSSSDMVPKVRIDLRLGVQNINDDIINIIQNMKPYGKANPAPIFAEKNMKVSRVWIMGKDKNVIKFRIAFGNGYKTIDAIGFGNCIDNFKEMFADKYGEDKLLKVLDSTYGDFMIDLLYVPSINEYKGNKSFQLEIKGMRL